MSNIQAGAQVLRASEMRRDGGGESGIEYDR